MKRTIIFILCAAAMALSGHAYVTIDDIYYNIENGEASVTYGDNYYLALRYTGDIVIPPSVIVNGEPYAVTSIGEYAFSECSQLANVSLPNTIKSIDQFAFSNCAGLTDIAIPNSVTSIGKRAFAYCTGLISLVIPSNVTFIGEEAFSNCNGIIEVSLSPNSDLRIGSGAFWCSGIAYVKTTDITKWCLIDFENRYSNPCAFGRDLYIGSKKIVRLEIPEGVKKIRNYAFCGCGFESVVVPPTIVSIGDFAFTSCNNLVDISIPTSVKSIGRGAFTYCHSLKYIPFPQSVDAINAQTFEYCHGFSSISIPDHIKTIGAQAFGYCENITNITIPSSVTSIGDKAFYKCEKLDKVTWNAINCSDFSEGSQYLDGSERVEIMPFKGVTSVTSFSFGSQVERIPACLLYGFKSVPNVIIPNSVKEIGDSAFFNCTGLTEVKFSNSLLSISESAFQGCSRLSKVVVPNSVTSIGVAAFYDCKNLKSVTLSTSVTAIASRTFSGCSNLTDITIPNSVMAIGYHAFTNCSSLHSISLPNSVKEIGNYAFASCSSLSSIELGSAVQTIGDGAFVSTKLNHITIPPSVTAIGHKAFPSSLVSVEWNAVNCNFSQSITTGWFTSSGCKLSSLKFGTSVETIPSLIGQGQALLKEITFPASVKRIGPNPLKGCTGLQKITSHITEPMTVALGLTDEQLAQLPLYIPKGTTEAYLNALGWADFANLIELSGAGKSDINEDGSIDGNDVSIQLEMVLAGDVTDELKAVADINGDGSVDGNDVSIVLEMVLAGE